MSYNFSYSSMADVYAVAEEEEGAEKEKMHEFAMELERMGTAVYGNTVYLYRDTNYGMEVVSMKDYQSETEDDEDEEEYE